MFPSSRDPKAWADLILQTLRVIAPNGEETRIQQIMDHLATDPSFPGSWDYLGVTTVNGKEIDKARTYMYSGIARLNEEGIISSPKKGLYSLIQITNPEQITNSEQITNPEQITNSEQVIQPEPNTQPAHLHVYARNTYLRQQAVEQAPCFGYHKHDDPECIPCPLATFCKAAKVAVLKHISSTLNTSKIETITPVPTPPKSPTHPNPPTTPKPNRSRLAASPIPFAANCSICKALITAGSPYIHVMDVGPVHELCAP